jgi:DNA-binding beta-propeller fold protein YncE
MEILTDPERLAFFLGIRMVVGEGNDQFVDDMYSTNDGRLLVVSRPSLADVVGIDIASGEIVWRFRVAGQRSDHMALSPDGTRVAVSASTGNVVHILDTQTGEEVLRLPSGDSPHENTYSADGSKIFHASIGLVYTPADQPALDSTKGERYFQIVDANTGEILKRITNMGQKIEDDTCGPDAVSEKCYREMSSAIRPMAISPDERFIYFQVSFFHGFIEYDVENDRVLRVAELPDFYGLPRETYILDSAHHGIAMNDAGTKLCVAGTMSDYAAIVSRADFEDVTIIQKEKDARSYWSTTSADGEHCFVSWSGTDSISAISYETEQEVDQIEVGDPDDGRRAHPQRVRTGVVRRDWVKAQG